MEYAVVIPAKNESGNIVNSIKSIVKQTVAPQRVLVIDDGSTDDTLDKVKELEKQFPILKHYENPQGGKYALGGHVVSVFNTGIQIIKESGINYSWIVKMDADIEFEENFIETISGELSHKNLGIVSGIPYYYDNQDKIYEVSPEWHTHGQFKIYNKKYLEQIEGIPESLGWDTADNIIALMNGWETAVVKSAEYKMHRKIGGKVSLKKGRINHGIGCYVLNYSLFYFLFKFTHDLFKPPLLLGSVYLLYGFILAHIKRPPKILDRRQSRLLRQKLWQSLLNRFNSKDFFILQKLSRRNG